MSVSNIPDLGDFLKLVDENGHPTNHPLAVRLRNIDNASLNIKQFGYELARQLADALPKRTGLKPTHIGLKSKPSTQKDLESDWAAYWCGQLGISVFFHRKLWELAYVLQTFHENGCLRPGARGLGFGCGEEPIPSFLAAKGIDVLVTDLAPDQVMAAGWAATNQHTASRDIAFRDYLVSREAFDRHVALRYVDMNEIPEDLTGFDFCWSICALEHIGSIAKGLDFLENSLKTLKSGGVSVHTTEFNFSRDDVTIDNWPTVLFQKRHFTEIAERLRAQGHYVAELDYNIGSDPLDKFIDVPPFEHDWTNYMREQWAKHSNHIKLSVDGFPATCFGIIIRKK